MPLAPDDKIRQELCTKLALACPHWSKERWDRFVFCLTPFEQNLEVDMYKDSATAAQPDFWSVSTTILTDVLAVAGVVTGITSAISGIQAVVKG